MPGVPHSNEDIVTRRFADFHEIESRGPAVRREPGESGREQLRRDE